MDPSISSVYVLLVQVTMTLTYQNDPKPHQPDERNHSHRGHHDKVHGPTIPLNHCPHQLKHPAANMTGQETG